MANEYEDRKRLTFAQAEGAEPLPTQLKLKEISPELRARLWAIFYDFLVQWTEYENLHTQLMSLLRDWHVSCRFRPADEFVATRDHWCNELKSIFFHGDYLRVFGFVEWVLRHEKTPDGLKIAVGDALLKSRAAYTLFDNDTIVPIGSDAERETLLLAFADVSAAEFHGARAHLRSAGSELTAGNYAGSVRESIQAVESVARVLEPTANALGPALSKLGKSGYIHGALGSGFSSLYGFTSDEKGIRHPLLDKSSAQVDETDALYMLGSCAAFVSYLINKARQAGLLSEPRERGPQ